MATIAVKIVTGIQEFPAGTAAGFFRVTLTDTQGGSAVLDSDNVDFVFPDVAPGDYTVVAERLDGNGVALVAPLTKTVNVPAGTVALSVPVDFSVEVA